MQPFISYSLLSIFHATTGMLGWCLNLGFEASCPIEKSIKAISCQIYLVSNWIWIFNKISSSSTFFDAEEIPATKVPVTSNKICTNTYLTQTIYVDQLLFETTQRGLKIYVITTCIYYSTIWSVKCTGGRREPQ